MKTHKTLFKNLLIVFALFTIGINGSSAQGLLSLKFFIQDYYLGSGMMSTPLFNSGLSNNTDEVGICTVELIDPISCTPVESIQGILKSNGILEIPFSSPVGNFYFIKISHHNTIQTYSSGQVLLLAITSYDFSLSMLNAYGNNMIAVEPNVWAFYSGDINQDCIIDAVDLTILNNGIAQFIFGYDPSDLNGDGFVDMSDFALMDAHLLNPVSCQSPCSQAPACSIFGDDYSSNSGWTQVGSAITVNSLTAGQVHFEDVPGNSDHRVYKNIGLLTNTWMVEFDAAPNGGSNDGVSAMLMCLSAGSDIPYRVTPTGAFTNQNHIAVEIASPPNTPDYTTSSYFYVTFKNDANAPLSSSFIPVPAWNVRYYFRLERFDAGSGLLSIFSDPLRRNHVAGSPICLNINGKITGLNTLQHANVNQAGSSRRFTGDLDNTCISSTPVNALSLSINSIENASCSTGGCFHLSYSGIGPFTFFYDYINPNDPQTIYTSPQSSSDALFCNLPPGQYALVIRDSCGNYKTIFGDILGTTRPVANAGPDIAICDLVTDIPLAGTPSVPGAIYFWTSLDGGSVNSGQGTSSITVSGLGCYQLVVLDPATNCSDTDTVCVVLRCPAEALDFDGVDDYISLGSNSQIRPENGLTVEIWVHQTDWSIINSPRTIIGNTETGGYSIEFDAGNLLKSWVYRNGAYGITHYNCSSLSSGWHHLAFTFDGNQNILYVDGAIVAVNEVLGGPFQIVYHSTNSTLVGAEALDGDTPEPGKHCPGKFDELRIWDHARNCNEINSTKNCELLGTETGLLAYYKFNQGIDAEANPLVIQPFDSKTNSYLGDLRNFTLNGPTSNWIAPGAVTQGTTCSGLMSYAEINIQGNNLSIADGDITPDLNDFTDFGNVALSTTVTRTFTIHNTGSAPLEINNITLSGPDAGLFSIGTLIPSSPIQPGSSATFSVSFTSTSPGLKSAFINVSNSDCDESDYSFGIQANVENCFSCTVDNKTPYLVINTGYNESINSAESIGSPDLNWKITQQPSWSSLTLPAIPSTIYYNPFNNPNFFPFPNSQWISPTASGNGLTNLPGDLAFTFEYDFCLCEDDSVTFDFHSLVDDSLVVYLDNPSTILHYQSVTLTGQQAGQQNYQYKIFLPKGTHKLFADLRNYGGPLGFNIGGTIAGDHLLKHGSCSSSFLYASAGSDIKTCNPTSAIALHASTNVVGGAISWSPLSSGSILSGQGTADPMVDGTDCYKLTVTDPNTGCEYTDTVCVTIITYLASWPNIYDVICSGDGPLQLSGASPSGGRYDGFGVDANGVFRPQHPESLGLQPLYYIYLNPCTNANDTLFNSILVIDCPCMPTVCRDFNDNDLHGWAPNPTAPNIGVTLSNTGSQLGTNDSYVSVLDIEGPSEVKTGDEFIGRWCCGEFCFDIKLFDDADNAAILSAQPTMFIKRGTKGFKYTSNTYITENSGWFRVCAPITNCNPMPISSTGVWTPLPGTSVNDWDPVTNHIDAISFLADQFGNAGEVWGFDNVCFNSTGITAVLTLSDCDTIRAAVSSCCGPYSYTWSGGTQVNDSTIASLVRGSTYTLTVENILGESTTTSITVPIDCCTNPQGNELVINGDFRNGVTGFSSDLNLNCTCGVHSYCVGPNARTKCAGFLSITDHSGLNLSASGPFNFLVVDGHENVASDVWFQNIGSINQGTIYFYSYWVYPLVSNSTEKPTLSIQVRDANNQILSFILNTTNFETLPNQWTQISGSWLATSNIASAQLNIRQTNWGYSGNDYGIDDISFRTCEPTPPPIPAVPGLSNIVKPCPGLSVGTITGNFSYTIPFDPTIYPIDPLNPNGWSWQWNTGSTSNIISGLSPGTYSVTLTSPTGITASSTYLLEENPPIVITVNSVQNITCHGGEDGSFDFSASGGTQPFTYEVERINALGCCASGNCGRNSLFSCQSCKCLSIVPGTYSDLDASQYVITVTDANGCSATQTITLTEPPALTYTIDLLQNVSCNGGNDGALTITGSGGSGTVEVYVISAASYTAGDLTCCNGDACSSGYSCHSIDLGNGRFTCECQKTATTPVAALTAGKHYISVYDAVTGCSILDSITITEPPAISLGSSFTPFLCFGGSTCVNITASGGTAPYSGTGSFCGIEAGITNFSVTDDNGCVANTSVTVTEPAKIEATFTVTPASCGLSNGTLIANATGGTAPYEYSLTGVFYQTSNNFGSLAADMYIVRIRDANGCLSAATVQVPTSGGLPNYPDPITGPAGACRNQNNIVFSIPPVSGADEYIWILPNGATGSSTGTSISLNFGPTFQGGFICVRAKNACGISMSTCFNIPVFTVKPGQPNLINGDAHPCGPNIYYYSIPNVTNAGSYNWSVTGTGVSILTGNGGNTVGVSIPAGFGQGSISVNVSNCIGTSSTRTLTLSGIPIHGNALNGPGFVCANSNGVAYYINTVLGTNGYVWNTTGDMSIASSNGPSCTVNFGPNFTTGTLEVITSSPCGSFVKSYTIKSVPGQPGSISGPGYNLCGKNGVTYSIASITSATSYIWTVPPGATITNNTGTSITVDFSTSFTTSGNICVTAISPCGSSPARCYLVNAAPAPPTSISGAASVCASAGASTYTVSPTAGATFYTWYATNGATVTPQGIGLSALVDFTSTTASPVSVRVKSNNICNFSGLTSKSVAVNLACREYGNQDILEKEAFYVYPNPTRGKIQIDFIQSNKKDCIFKLIDLLGNLVDQFNVAGENGMNTVEIDLSYLNKGMYFIVLERSSTEAQKQKIIVQ